MGGARNHLHGFTEARKLGFTGARNHGIPEAWNSGGNEPWRVLARRYRSHRRYRCHRRNGFTAAQKHRGTGYGGTGIWLNGLPA